MLDQYELRQVRLEEDWAAYHRIRERVLWEARGRFNRYDRNHPEEGRPGFTSLLLLFQGTAVGTVRLDDNRDGTGIVRLVAISTEAQGKGHGRALLALIEKCALAAGIGTLEVNSAKDAVGFYQAAGYAMIAPERDNPLLRKVLRS